MAHGWDSYFPNLPPRSPDPRSLRRPAESGRHPSHHVGNFVGHNNFSGTSGSREVPAPNTNFNVNYSRNAGFETSRSDCAYNRYYERQWQGDRQHMGRDYPQRFRHKDFPNYASNPFPTSAPYHSSFAQDFHHPKQDRDMRTTSYRGNYSTMTNCSDTDGREARPSCKFTRNNFFPRPKPDIGSNETSTKCSFSATGYRNSQTERPCPNTSETSSLSDKYYREHNHPSPTSSYVRNKGNEYDGNYDFHYQKHKLDMDGDIVETAYSNFHMSEKCSGVGNRQHLVDKKDDLLKSTDDQDTVLNDKLEKSQVLKSFWEKSSSLDEELLKDKTPLILNSSCEDKTMEADKHEREIQKDTSQLLVLNESSSSDDEDDEQSESISSSNNHDIEFSLQLPEPESSESLGGVSDHSSDSNADTNITEENPKDEEFSSISAVEKSTFSSDVDCVRPGDTCDHISEETSDHERKVVFRDESFISSQSSSTEDHLQTGLNVTSTAKSKTLSEEPDFNGPAAFKENILRNSANSQELDAIPVVPCLQPSSSGTDIYSTVQMEEKSPPEKNVIISQDGHAANGVFSDRLGDRNHKCVESHKDSLLKHEDSGTNLDTVNEKEIPPLMNSPNSPVQTSSPTATRDNISVDTNDIVSNSELLLKQDSSGTALQTDQEMGSPLDKESQKSPSSEQSLSSVTHEIPSNDDGDIIIRPESLHPNLLNTDQLPCHPEECENPVESTDVTSHADQKSTARAVKTDRNIQRDFNDLKFCSEPNAGADVSSLSEEELINQPNTNLVFSPSTQHAMHGSVTSQEQTQHDVDFLEDEKDSFKKLDLSLSEPGLLYGEPLSGDESSLDVEKYDQETPETRPEAPEKRTDEDQINQLRCPAPQLTSSLHMRPLLHPVVILMGMESTDEKSNTYNCGDCSHTTNSVDHLIEHHYDCHPMPSYQFCKNCNMYLIKNDLDKPHSCDQIISQRKKNCGPYKCSRCGLMFSRILHYVKHMRDHTGRTPYMCSGCGSYFSQSSALNHHRRVPGRCSQSLTANSNDTIKIKTKRPKQKNQAQNASHESMIQCYVRLVDISKTNLCKLCGKSFLDVKKTKKHMYNVHKRKKAAPLSNPKSLPSPCQNKTEELYKCPLCPRRFSYSNNRARHLRFCVRNAIYRGKKNVDGKYVCPLCKTAFTASGNRYRHIKLTCLRETFNRLARGKPRLRQKSEKENEQKPQSKESIRTTQDKEGEAKKLAPLGSTTSTVQYKCNHCPAIFFHPSGKYKHMKKHELYKRTGKIVKYRKSAFPKTESAGDTITEESTSKPDMTEELPKPTLSCHFCGLSFHLLSTMKRHQRSHRGERPYRCLECRKGFKQRHHLIGHRVVHQKRIQCTVCRKILPTIGDLIQHRSSHLKKGKLQCPDCPAQFPYPVYLLRHMEAHKKKEKSQKSEEETRMKPQQSSESVKEINKPKLSECSLCKETFDDAHVLRKHSLTHISGSSNRCPYCKIQFTSRYSLIRHMVKHTGDKPFSCAKCGRQFYRSVYLKIHSETCAPQNNYHPIDVNTGNPTQKRHCCTICPRRFWKRIRLEMHLKAHKNKSLKKCTDCDQWYGVNMMSRHKLVCIKTEATSSDKSTICSFETSSTKVTQNVQKTPSSSHANKMMPFKCPYCSKRFRYRSLLLRHTVTHTGVQPFRCMHCDQGFRSQTTCINHEAFCDGGSKTVGSNSGSKLQMNTDADVPSQKDPPQEVELKCKFCTKTFLKARSLRRHILTHNEVKPYRCKACESCFSRYDHLKVHQALCKIKKTRLEVKIPKIILEDIGKGWQSNLHLKPCDEQKSFECKVCLKSFPNERKLSRHNTMFHTVKRFKCGSCGSAFTHEKTLRAHQRVKRCKKQRNESFTPLVKTNKPTDNIDKQLDGIRKNIFVRIQPLFNKDLKFICSYCPRAFKNGWQLNVHTRLHTGERPYSCDHCGERFIRRDYLVRHYLKCKDMTQPSNALCDKCGGFFTEKQLENHKKTCTLRSCSPTISKSKQLSQNTPKGFSCAYCNSRFLLFSQLQEHFLTTHKLETEISSVSAPPLQQLLSNIPKIKEEPVDETYGKVSSDGADKLSKPEKALTADTSNLFVCQTCNMRFSSKSGLIGHQRAHAEKTPYTCKHCNRGFWNKTQLRNHYRKCIRAFKLLDVPVKAEVDVAFGGLNSKDNFDTTTRSKVLPTKVACKEESEESISLYSYKDNSSKPSEEKKTVQYQCSECEKTFTDGLLLISHLEDHGREEQDKKSNKCSKCGRMFSNQGNLRRHMKLHMTQKRYYCSSCPKVFTTMSEFEKHNSSHERDKPHACKLCEQRFLMRLDLCEHYRGDHADEIFHCQFCTKVYANIRSLYRHHKKWHPKEKRDMKTAQPQRASVDQQSSSHVSTNGDSDEDQNLDSDSDSDSAPYFPCHVCGKTFLTSETLEDHQLCHLGKKPHECAECGKCFFQASQLQQHQRMHKSEFQCTTCGRGFVTLFALRTHKHSHGKTRPFRCSKCDLGFAGPTQLAEHMSTHREESFPCDICNKIFQSKSSRAEHRKTHSMFSEGALPSVSRKEQEQPKSMLEYSTEFKYRCGICSERFRDPEELSEHGCLEAVERAYTCTECNKHFLHASHLKKHQSTHQQSWSDREYPCNQCNSSFSSSHLFLNHLKTHVGTAIGTSKEQNLSDGFICPVCHQCFANGNELIHHFPTHPDCAPEKQKDTSGAELVKQKVLRIAAPPQYKCAQCSGVFVEKEALRLHHCSLQQPVEENMFSDPGNEIPADEAALDEEEVDVTGEDLHKCHVCSMQFFSKSSLLEHQNNQHPNNWREFKCETCGKTFAKKRYLRKHELKQHGPKEQAATPVRIFKCAQCRAKFLTTQDLLNHMRLHAEKQAGDYRCDMCYKSFSKRSLLKQHQESHVGEVVYECTECDKAFAFPHLLEEHQRSHSAPSK